MHVDTFSGAAAELPPNQRHPDNVLEVLRKNPRVSTWDMGELQWLRSAIKHLEEKSLIIRDKSEGYPWLRYNVIGQTNTKDLK